MTEPVNIALIAAIAGVLGTIVGGIFAFVLARRMQPSAIRASDAAAAETDAKAAGLYIDNQNKLLDMFTTEALSKAAILTELGGQRALLIAIQGENAQLKVDFLLVTQRAEAAEARAIGCEREVLDYRGRYGALELKNDALELKTSDYVHRLEVAEAEIASLKAAAVIVADTNAASAQAELAKAATALIVAGGMPALPPDAVAPPTLPPALSDKE